ncbi:DnaB-like helicase C-terminal domain-containing protein [Geobacillus stearothermophilus]|uniref:replicative DNA helicase n=1 Tax=Geobacillus stearothermophilus TaxID=1422 RepID=UPI002E1A960F|nr:DnaB-like helicase C-terminal domain-containing protein [Geobacillus stearothermophilus]MED5040830.1 DnaB-like helicase C-terminal domain-containing protein [Geobacillus stearothermophilus]
MSVEAEKAVLGTFLECPYLLKETVLTETHFSDPKHRKLFAAMKRIAQQDELDIVTLSTREDVANFGGLSYLNEISAFANETKFDQYESLVLDEWKEREKRRILVVATQENWDIDKITTALTRLNEGRITDHHDINDLLQEVAEAPWVPTERKRGAPSGISELDKMLNGFNDGDSIILAARPSMGKTDFMIHFAKSVGWHGYLPIVFSLEMAADKIRDRLIGSIGGFNRMKLRNPYHDLSEEQKRMWIEVIGKASETRMQIFDGAGQSIADIRSKIRKSINRFPDRKPVVFIDYLTLIRPERYYGGNMHLQVTEISRSIKETAKEFSCPIITLAQLSRDVEKRSDKRPLMSDIRESGSIEQDADVIIFLYRDSYYNAEADPRVAEVIVAKSRNGAVGTVRVSYNRNTGVIQDLYRP